nr:Uncharacterised protein [Klebsiella pneumoniae]
METIEKHNKVDVGHITDNPVGHYSDMLRSLDTRGWAVLFGEIRTGVNMYDDYDKREANIASFLSNKIKRCIKCGRELDYKEKFYYTDRICNLCRGLQPFDSEDVPEVESEVKSPFPIINLDLSKYEDKGQQNRSDFEKQVFSRYPEWQLLREKRKKIGMQLIHGLRK